MIKCEMLITPNQETTKAILKEDQLCWWEQGQEKSIPLADVVGVKAIADTSFVLNAYPRKKNNRILQQYYFKAASEEARTDWIKAINNTLGNVGNLLIIINPNSGKKKALSLWHQVKDLFDKSNFSYRVIIPLGLEKLKEMIAAACLKDLDGVVIIGGDGTVYRVVNELFKLNKHIPFGVIGGGTGNGLCKSVLENSGETYGPMNAAFVIAKGKTKPLDIILTLQGEKKYYSLLSLSWGLISDVDIESDSLRWLGSIKNDIYALLRIIKLRYYPGKLSFLPKNQEKWHIIESEFVLLWAMNVPWAAHNLKPAPLAKMANGEIDILVVRRGISRPQLVKAFLLIAEGKHLKIPCIEYYKASSLRLDPLTAKGILALDGEQVAYKPIEIRIMENQAKIYCLTHC